MPAALLEHVRLVLERARDRGVPFREVWPGVLAGASGQPDIDSWCAALAETAEFWERAYDRKPPTPGEEALLALVGQIRDPELVDLAFAERVCEQCGGRISSQRDVRIVYCSDGCRAKAWRLAQVRTDTRRGSAGVRSGVPDSVAVTTTEPARSAA